MRTGFYVQVSLQELHELLPNIIQMFHFKIQEQPNAAMCKSTQLSGVGPRPREVNVHALQRRLVKMSQAVDGGTLP